MRVILAYSCWICLRVLCWCIILLALTLVLLNLSVRAVLLYEEDIADWASDSFGVEFSANIESARWLGMRPEFFVSQVSLGEGESALKVAEVTAEPDLLRSLLSLSPSWQDLRLEGVELVLLEQEGGGWQIAGIDLVSRGNNGQATVLEKMLLGSRRIVVSDIQARLQFLSGTEIAMHLDNAQIENSLGFHRLVVDAALDDTANQLQAIVELTGISNRFHELDGMAYASFQGGDLTDVLTTLIGRYSDSPMEIASKPSVSGELWANIHSGSRAEFQGYLGVTDMPGQIFSGELEDLNFHSDISGHFYYFEDQLAVDFVQPDFSAAAKEWPLRDFRITRSRGSVGSSYSLQMHSLDLEALTERLSDLYALPDQLKSVIQDLDPSGIVENIEVNLDGGAPMETLSVSADLNAVDLGYFKNAPAARNLTGHLMANANSGRLEVDAGNLSMHYPKLYDWWLDHGSVTGTVGWKIYPEENKLQVYGENLKADAIEGQVRGGFLVDASTVPREEGMDFYLNMGFQNSSAEHWSKFVPRAAPESLKTWLSSAALAGEVPSGSVVYRGKVKKGYEDYRSMQLRFQTKQAQANYLDSWPRATDVDAEISISNRMVNIKAEAAKLPGIEIGNVHVQLNALKDAGTMELSADGSGATDSMLDLVRETSLRAKVGTGLDQFVFGGDSNLSLRLQMPLKKELATEDVDLDLEVRLQNNSLALTGQRLEFEGVAGSLFYGEKGIQAESISAELWREPMVISLREERDQGIINLSAKGAVDVASIGDWLNLELLDNFSGKAQVDTLFQINTNSESENASRYLFGTDMVGIESRLPGDFLKPQDEEALVSLVIEGDQDQHYRLEWSKGLMLELHRVEDELTPAGRFESAVLSMNTETPEHQQGKFVASFYQEDLLVEDWLAALFPEVPGADLDPDPNTNTSPESSRAELLGLAPDFHLATERLLFKETDYGFVEAGVTTNDHGWLVEFNHSFAAGDYLHPYEQSGVPSLHLTELDLDAYRRHKEATADLDEGSDFDPRTLPALDVSVQNLTAGSADKGSWRAQLRPSQFGLSIENIGCAFNSLTCGTEEPSSLFWAYDINGEYSALSLSLSFEDVSDLFGLAGMESPITSSSGEFYASINWDAPPQNVLDTPLSGILGVELEKGEFSTQANGVGAGIMRLVGLVNIDTWLRRLQFDFSDVSAGGTAYDELGGDFTINQSVVETLTPVYVELPSGKMLFDGAVDLEKSQVDAQLVVTLPARQNATWVAALAAGLPAAVGVWVVGQIFDDQLDSLASVSYQVTGPLDEPEVKTERIFDATVQE